MTENKPFQFRFFLPDARLLEKDEIAGLRKRLGPSSTASDENGLWIEMTCSDRSCLDEEGRLKLPVAGEQLEKKGIFLDLFCPEDSCEIIHSTDLP